jgi:hypothetical protein
MSSIDALPNYTKYYGLSIKGSASTGIIFAIFAVSLDNYMYGKHQM